MNPTSVKWEITKTLPSMSTPIWTIIIFNIATVNILLIEFKIISEDKFSSIGDTN